MSDAATLGIAANLNLKLFKRRVAFEDSMSRKNVLLTGIVVVMVLGNIGFVVLSFRLVTFADLEKIASVTMSIDVLGAATDIYIAATLCYLLARSRTGFKKSDDMIKTLLMRGCNADVVRCEYWSLIASPYSLVFAAFYFCIGRRKSPSPPPPTSTNNQHTVYTNSFLASLNARRTISGKAVKQDTSHLLISIPTNVLGPETSNGGGHTSTSTTTSPAADNFKENRNSTLVPFKRRTRCGSTFKVNVNVSVETMRGTTTTGAETATSTNRDYDDADLDSEFGQGRESLRGGGGNVEV
ncbi:hypothetical protein H0H93_012720 [Arthromyces matolae]|nr:hypothetical protein H0H93_012720 [Arthromyces matolae]